MLVGLTVATALAGQWLARRDLGVAAEALTTVALGLVVLDLFGAENAGWLGTPSDESFLVIVGASLLAVSLGLCLPARRLFAPQLAAPLGLGIAVVGAAGANGHDQVVATIAVLCFTGLAVAGRALGTVVLPWTSAAGAGLALTALTGSALTDAAEHPTLRGPLGRGSRHRAARGRRARAAPVGGGRAATTTCGSWSARPRPRCSPSPRPSRSSTRAPPRSRSPRRRARWSGRSRPARLRRGGTPSPGCPSLGSLLVLVPVPGILAATGGREPVQRRRPVRRRLAGPAGPGAARRRTRCCCRSRSRWSAWPWR